MSDNIRTFIAFPLPGEITACIRTVQDSLRAKGFRMQWVRPGNIHLTLRFLGDIPRSRVEAIAAEMDAAARQTAPFILNASGIGVFPGIRRARVLWLGLGGDIRPLIRFQAFLNSRLETLGFPKEGKPFRAHLTLARIKEPLDPRKLVAAMEDFSDFASEPFTAGEIVLFQSTLKPSGAVYTRLHSAVLGG